MDLRPQLKPESYDKRKKKRERDMSFLLYVEGAGGFVTKISLDKNVLPQDKLELSHPSFPLSSLTIGGPIKLSRETILTAGRKGL